MINPKIILQTSAFCFTALIMACSGNTKNVKQIIANDTAKTESASDGVTAIQTDYQKETTDTLVAQKLRGFLLDYLNKDLAVMSADDRSFSYYALDLNADKKDEYFIRLNGSYFCGSGGCTFLLLDNTFKLINRFTVMKAPVFRSSKVTNGWNELIVHGSTKDKFVHLVFDPNKGKYPANPTVEKESDLAPSGHDYVMWHDDFSKAQLFKF
ncbi:hypothetical protein [Sphingobacterium sp.]|uniref:hypothetical protein n=1 Tax=Sphingobacterium sp. TaxID=341027 RepID=UPI0031CFA8A6